MQPHQWDMRQCYRTRALPSCEVQTGLVCLNFLSERSLSALDPVLAPSVKKSLHPSSASETVYFSLSREGHPSGFFRMPVKGSQSITQGIHTPVHATCTDFCPTSLLNNCSSSTMTGVTPLGIFPAHVVSSSSCLISSWISSVLCWFQIKQFLSFLEGPFLDLQFWSSLSTGSQCFSIVTQPQLSPVTVCGLSPPATHAGQSPARQGSIPPNCKEPHN